MKLETYEQWLAIARSVAREWLEDSWSSTDVYHQAVLRLRRRFGPGLWTNPRAFVNDAYFRREVEMTRLDRARRKAAAKRGRGWRRIELEPEKTACLNQGGALDLFTSEPEKQSQENIDYVIRAAHLDGISPFKIAKYLRLSGYDQNLKIRYVEAKIRLFEREEESP